MRIAMRAIAAMAVVLYVAFASGTSSPAAESVFARENAPGEALARSVRLGVLAYRGAEAARERWRPLLSYLNDRIAAAGLPFRLTLRPVTLDTARVLLKGGQIDYLLTNPGHYVTLASEIPLAPIATMERFAPNGRGLVRFGSVIFTRASAKRIHTLADLKGRTLTAVSPDAFGGFQVAWAEFIDQDIDPFRDLKALRFAGFPQDAIVEAVLRGESDAGVVRTGLLESLAREGRLDLSRLRVLQAARIPDWPLLVSTRLYPEWPFLARAGADKRLTETIARSLLDTQDPALRKRRGLRVAWTTPRAYDDVRALERAYAARRAKLRNGGLTAFLTETLPLVLALVLSLTLALYFVTQRRRPAPRSAMRSGHEPVYAPPIDPAVAEGFRRLTPREQQVLALLCQGKSTKAIARELSISPKTVEHHRASLLKKTGVKSATSLVWLATRQGLDRMKEDSETP